MHSNTKTHFVFEFKKMASFVCCTVTGDSLQVAEVMEKYPPILTEVDATFQFSVKGHSEWFIIVKAPKGEVRQVYCMSV